MKRIAVAAVLIVFVLGALAAGYWWGAKQSAVTATVAGASGMKAERKLLYYRNPMGLPDTSLIPKKAPDGMDYVPVYADEEAGSETPQAKGKILYYRNPMGLPDTSPVAKKDPMGMDYVPVYEGGEPAGGPVVKINPDKVQKLGVKTEVAAMRALTRTVRAVGTVQADERRLYTVAPKFDGWIQKLHVNTTGQPVTKGQALMDVYSPDLISAQQEYLIAWKGVQSLQAADTRTQAWMQDLMDSALMRLRNWDISEEELKWLKQGSKPRQFVTLRSQANGVVVEKPSIEGKRFMAGEALYQIADFSSVWVIADVFEQDLAFVSLGQAVKIKVDAYADKEFAGKVTFIYPTLTPETRTAKVRIELPNVQRLLKPAMYARMEIASRRSSVAALTVPDSAILDTGTRQLVLIRRGEGAFEPRTVKTGLRADNYVEVLDGVRAGEMVVVSANFLIDAESNLKAALGGMGGMAMGDAKPAAPPLPISKDAAMANKPAALPPPISKDTALAKPPQPSGANSTAPPAGHQGH